MYISMKNILLIYQNEQTKIEIVNNIEIGSDFFYRNLI